MKKLVLIERGSKGNQLVYLIAQLYLSDYNLQYSQNRHLTKQLQECY